MDQAILAQRNAIAQQRIVAAAKSIAGKLDIAEKVTALESTSNRDPQIRTLLQREAVADLLDVINLQLIAPVTVDGSTDQATPSEMDRLAQFILKNYQSEIGTETSESAVDVAIRLLTPKPAEDKPAGDLPVEESGKGKSGKGRSAK